MNRYIINISFKTNHFLRSENTLVDSVKTLREAKSYESIIDDTVDKAFIRDMVTGNLHWLKK